MNSSAYEFSSSVASSNKQRVSGSRERKPMSLKKLPRRFVSTVQLSGVVSALETETTATTYLLTNLCDADVGA